MIDDGLLVSHHTQHYFMSKKLHFGLKYHLENSSPIRITPNYLNTFNKWLENYFNQNHTSLLQTYR